MISLSEKWKGGIIMSNNFKERDREVQKKKRSDFLKKIKKIVKLIGTIGTTFSVITGMSFYTAIRMMSVEFDSIKEENTNSLWYFLQPYVAFVLEHFMAFLSVSFVIVGIVKLIIIPNYEIHKEDKPPLEAYPTTLTILSQVAISCLAITMCVFCTIFAKESYDDQSELTLDIDDVIEETVTFENIFSEEQEIVNNYIERSSSDIISIEELNNLSDNELYYIRNGIYAYEGYYFNSGYYDEFPWYNGHILPDDFNENMLNHCQIVNIHNIKYIEDQRKELNK